MLDEVRIDERKCLMRGMRVFACIIGKGGREVKFTSQAAGLKPAAWVIVDSRPDIAELIRQD